MDSSDYYSWMYVLDVYRGDGRDKCRKSISDDLSTRDSGYDEDTYSWLMVVTSRESSGDNIVSQSLDVVTYSLELISLSSLDTIILKAESSTESLGDKVWSLSLRDHILSSILTNR